MQRAEISCWVGDIGNASVDARTPLTTAFGCVYLYRQPQARHGGEITLFRCAHPMSNMPPYKDILGRTVQQIGCPKMGVSVVLQTEQQTDTLNAEREAVVNQL